TERALTKRPREISYSNILVPVFGTELDDDIVSTAGRLAAATAEESDGRNQETRLEVVYVLEVPLTLPLDADLPGEREEEARRAAGGPPRGGGESPQGADVGGGAP